MNSPSQITRLLKDAQDGSRRALDELLPLVYDELKRVAARQLSGERGNHTLQATALVHEAYLRLIDQHSVDWSSRAHFFSIAAEMMRRILVNHAESRAAKKRGSGATAVSLDEIGDGFGGDFSSSVAAAAQNKKAVDVLALDDALKRLAALDAQQAKIVELKFFAGLTNEDAASVLGISDSTVKREWRAAKAWLSTQLT